MSVLNQAFFKAYQLPGTVVPSSVPPAAEVPAVARYVEPTLPAMQPVLAAPPAPPPSAPPAPAIVPLVRPSLQVDAFAWPATVVRLCKEGRPALAALGNQLLASLGQGKCVVGWTGCQAGDGATTLLLCLARLVAACNVRAAVVDADCRAPALALGLGVEVEQGWEDDALPLGEVAIESVQDRLTLVPRIAPATDLAAAGGGLAKIVAALRRHYDLVWIDLGTVESAARLLQAAPGHLLDRALVVRNARTSDAASLAGACRVLRSAGVADVAGVENFG